MLLARNVFGGVGSLQGANGAMTLFSKDCPACEAFSASMVFVSATAERMRMVATYQCRASPRDEYFKDAVIARAAFIADIQWAAYAAPGTEQLT